MGNCLSNSELKNNIKILEARLEQMERQPTTVAEVIVDGNEHALKNDAVQIPKGSAKYELVDLVLAILLGALSVMFFASGSLFMSGYKEQLINKVEGRYPPLEIVACNRTHTVFRSEDAYYVDDSDTSPCRVLCLVRGELKHCSDPDGFLIMTVLFYGFSIVFAVFTIAFSVQQFKSETQVNV